MKSPNTKEWEELPDGTLRYISTKTHTDSEVLLIPVEVCEPPSKSRVQLAWRHRETGAMAYWSDSTVALLRPRVLALSTAIERARVYCRDTRMLLKIGITDEHEYSPYGPSRW